MLNFPEIQLKAQEEVDRVVGRSRLPYFADEADMPYLSAVVKEVFRFVDELLSWCLIIADLRHSVSKGFGPLRPLVCLLLLRNIIEMYPSPILPRYSSSCQ
jgi:hypothetical protein